MDPNTKDKKKHKKSQEEKEERADKRLSRAVVILGAFVLVLAIVAAVMVISYFRTGKNTEQDTAAVTNNAGTDGKGSDKKQTGSSDASSTGDSSAASSSSAAQPSETPTPTPTPTAATQLDVGEINSAHAVLYRLSDWTKLYDKAAQERMYPASMTKIMTAILTIENYPDLDTTLSVDQETYDYLYNQDASMAGFQPGENVTIRDLLYGMLLPSGAECCLTVAKSLDGSEAAFADRMNQKAAEIGMANTHFVTATGLHDDNHYSTAEDMALLFKYCLADGDFRAVVTSRQHTTQPTDQHPDGITLSSTLFSTISGYQIDAPEILGGKTGYTDEAGHCLASLASVGGQEYILVTAGAPGASDSAPNHVIDTHNIYQHIGG